LKENHKSDKPLCDPKNVKKEQLNMIIVDADMVAQLNKDECNNFIGFLASLRKGDGRLAVEKLMRLSSPSDDYVLSDQMKVKFTRDMVALFRKLCRGYGTNAEIGVLLREILSLIRIHRVRIAANYATIVINVLCIESLATRVAPDYNLLDAARPLLESYDS
jgi:aarF domain-containing kinase